MNTHSFNNRVQKAKDSAARLKMRGPSHGLIGDAHSQRPTASSSSTRSFRHSEIQQLREQGEAAEAQEIAIDLPSIIEEQSYQQYDDFDMPGDFSASSAKEGRSSEHLTDEDEVHAACKEVQTEYRDFRTRRERTHVEWSNWEPQLDGMAQAYMDWCLRERREEILRDDDCPQLLLTVVDIFGALF